MSRLRYSRRQAVEHLKSSCPEMGRFVIACGPLKLRTASDADLFAALARAIVYQQLSGKAAGTIHGRFVALFEQGIPTAAQTMELDYQALRGAGLSNNKALAVQDLAARALDGSLPSARRAARLSDDEVVQKLCQVRGVGPWTAQMYLMFNLGRPDVMPATDLGVQKGVQAVYGLDAMPAPDEVLQRTSHLAPFRSAASWYLWQAADTVLL